MAPPPPPTPPSPPPTRGLRRLAGKLRTFARLPLSVQAGLLPVWVLLGVAKLLIFTLPFARLAPRLGQALGPVAWVPLLDAAQARRARWVHAVVPLAAGYAPWNANCFPQAVVARALLGLLGVPFALHFGLRRDPASGAMKAHAWVMAGRLAVTGGASFQHYTVVGCYVSRRLVA